jgi:1,4-dihydroxy-2-naphthoate octaprenyltransferase
MAMLIAIEFPDAVGDALAGKSTLVVRLGTSQAARLYVALVLAAYVALGIGAVTVLPARVAIAGAASSPIAIWRCVRIAEYRDPSAWERFTFWAVALLVATATAELTATLSLRAW